MKEKRLLKKVWRYHRISHNERLEGLVSLYKDTIYIKVDSVYDDLKPRKTHYETYLTFGVHYDEIIEILIHKGTTEKLARKIKIVMAQWKANGLFSFDEANIIVVNGGQNDDKQ